MSSMRVKARLDTSHHGPSHSCKDSGVVDRHPQCDGEVPLRCQQVLHAQGYLDVPRGKNSEYSNMASVEFMQWVLCLAIGHHWCY
jgi:hypothetical protein